MATKLRTLQEMGFSAVELEFRKRLRPALFSALENPELHSLYVEIKSQRKLIERLNRQEHELWFLACFLADEADSRKVRAALNGRIVKAAQEINELRQRFVAALKPLMIL
jgi:hypothetical protein